MDIDPRFKPDIVADVRALPLKPFHVDVLWASPPCTEFSKFGLRCFYPNPPEPDLSIVQAVKDFIAYLRPRFWWVENVRSSRPWLTKIFGPVRANIPGHALWSNQLLLLPNIEPHKSTIDELTARGVDAIPKRGERFADKPRKTFRGREERHVVGSRRSKHGADLAGAADAAIIPREIGEAICRAVEAREE